MDLSRENTVTTPAREIKTLVLPSVMLYQVDTLNAKKPGQNNTTTTAGLKIEDIHPFLHRDHTFSALIHGL
ncbi:hypothetical protein N7468_003559 [Penicillium chermesinum]|uniref:Uncharacterized protein n=1 Tax=Penicillium chermesinum TaxID=63820 RepID=A0A9W9P6U5_9EURO|nr:uncharacterized protein N7468_003559 [Penicillium chermesinum]KAJ5238940.1 hypothetical protein N7468_003559 [Penicillium chermesinum]KAJ6164582.1 hypothetical protein N7470_003254 [Penicillium chermesinum]